MIQVWWGRCGPAFHMWKQAGEATLSDRDGTALPLSAAQREIWFAEQQLNTANRFYKTGGYVEIYGPVDPVLFEGAQASTKHHISAVTEIMINNARLALDFTPGRFHGHLLLFNLTIDRGDDAATPGMWRPYVDSTIEATTSPVDTTIWRCQDRPDRAGPGSKTPRHHQQHSTILTERAEP